MSKWIEKDKIAELLNDSVVRPRFPSFYGEADFRCVELTFDKETFAQLEQLLGCKIRGRLYEGLLSPNK